MAKLNKESILPLASMLTGMDYTQGLLDALEELKYKQEYGPVTYSKPSQLTKKQIKARAKAKAAKKARKRK
jgi:hypothetical protein